MKPTGRLAWILLLGLACGVYISLHYLAYVENQAARESTVTAAPTASQTAIPYPPRYTRTPSPAPTSTTTPFPGCPFPVKGQPGWAVISNLDQFIFTNPQTVLASDYPIEILNWMPDSEQLIISRKPQSQGYRNVEIFNTRDKTSTVIGDGYDTWKFNAYGGAEWSEPHQAVVYFETITLKKPILRIRNLQQQDLIPPVRANARNFALDFNGNVLFFSENNPSQLVTYAVQQKSISGVNIYPPLPETPNNAFYWKEYKIAPQPNGHQWVIYNDTGTYAVDTRTQQMCEIDLGMRDRMKVWASLIQWSPDGRFMAAIIAIGQPVVPFLDLLVLDTWTGKRWTLDIGRQIPINAMTWSPNSRNLVVFNSIVLGPVRDVMPRTGQLQLLDVFTNKSRQILIDYPFTGSAGHSGLAWSPDGKKIAMECGQLGGRGDQQGQLCLIEVQETP